LEGKRKVTYEQGKELAKQYGISFLETSAKDTINIDELFIGTTKSFLEKQNTNNVKKDIKNTQKSFKRSSTNAIPLTEPKEKKKKGCC
jgi:Ras-related protein Rab-8A